MHASTIYIIGGSICFFLLYCKWIKWQCRVLHQLLVGSFRKIVYILSCCPLLHCLIPFFNLITYQTLYFTKTAHLICLQERIEELYQLNLGTLVDSWKHCIFSTGPHLQLRYTYHENVQVSISIIAMLIFVCFNWWEFVVWKVCWIHNWQVIEFVAPRTSEEDGKFRNCACSWSYWWCRQKSGWYFAEKRVACTSAGKLVLYLFMLFAFWRFY